MVKYNAANAVTRDNVIHTSWPVYAIPHYISTALYQGEFVDEAFECLNKMYKAQCESDQSPWDTYIMWKGEGNRYPYWGRWYMTNTSTWFVPLALSGFAFNIHEGELKVDPHLPKAIGNGKELKDLPIFMPHFWANLNYKLQENQSNYSLEIDRLENAKTINISKLVFGIPADIDEIKSIKLKLNGKNLKIKSFLKDTVLNVVEIQVSFSLKSVKNILECSITYTKEIIKERLKTNTQVIASAESSF